MVPSQIQLCEWMYSMRTRKNHRVNMLVLVALLENETRAQRSTSCPLNHVPTWDLYLVLPLECRTPLMVWGLMTMDSIRRYYGLCWLVPILIIWDIHSSYCIGSTNCRYLNGTLSTHRTSWPWRFLDEFPRSFKTIMWSPLVGCLYL